MLCRQKLAYELPLLLQQQSEKEKSDSSSFASSSSSTSAFTTTTQSNGKASALFSPISSQNDMFGIGEESSAFSPPLFTSIASDPHHRQHHFNHTATAAAAASASVNDEPFTFASDELSASVLDEADSLSLLSGGSSSSSTRKSAGRRKTQSLFDDEDEPHTHHSYSSFTRYFTLCSFTYLLYQPSSAFIRECNCFEFCRY